jgi:hypothetical protein
MDYERKLRKKAKKLAKWAKRNGFEYVHVGVMAPDASSNKWFTDVTAHHMTGWHNVSACDLYDEEEL